MKSITLKIFLSLVIALLFTIIEEPFSFLLWLISFALGRFLSFNLFTEIRAENYFDTFYYIFSVMGLIICIDNYFNFGTLTGFAGDDTRFFNATKYLVGQGTVPTMEISGFSYLLTIIAFPLSLIKEVSLTDLIVINWLFAGLIAVLLNKLFYLITYKNIPLFVFILAYPMQFIITDTFTRFYRDSILIFFLVSAVISVYTSSNRSTLLSIIPVGLLRVANVSFIAILKLFKYLKVRKLITLIIILFSITILFVNFLPRLVQFGMIYGSDVSRIERYEDAFSSLKKEEVMDSRFSEVRNSGNSLMEDAYKSTSFPNLIIRATFSYAYPLSFLSPNSFVNHSHLGKIEGFYFYYVINWLNTLSICIVFPLLVIGIIKNKNPDFTTLIGTYFVFLILVLLISGQGRHTIGSFVFHSIFVANGFYLIKENWKLRQINYFMTTILFLLMLIYNLNL